jgi:hypothetical protein
MPQKPGRLGRVRGGSGEAARAATRVEAATAGGGDERSGTGGLLELVCERQNLMAALKRVQATRAHPASMG